MFVHIQHVVSMSTSIFQSAITAWTISFLLCSFITTLYSTGEWQYISSQKPNLLGCHSSGLIAYKLIKSGRDVREFRFSSRPSAGHRIMRILVESAVIYSTMHLLYAILYAVNSNIEATPSFMVCRPLVPTAQMLMGLHRKQVLRVSPAV